MAEGGAPLENKRRTLECSICLHRFRNPKTLPCLHSFCEDCLTNYAPYGTKTLACPLCKERIEVPNGDASKFKSNFHLKELVEEVVLTDKVTKHSTEIVCNSCDEELVAVSKCLDCDQYLCSPCLKAHKRFPALREHAIATFDEIKTGKIRPRSSIKRQLMCNRHQRNKAEIFCTTCEMPICHVCATLKHKSPDHECIEASEATDTRRKHALEGLEQLSIVETLFNEASTKASKTHAASRECVAKLKLSIETRFKFLIDKLESDKGKLFATLDAKAADETHMLVKYMLSVKDTIDSLQHIQEEAKILVEDASDADFLSFHGVMKCKLDHLCLTKPRIYLSTLECLVFQETELTSSENFVGLIKEAQIPGEFKSVNMKLVKEYRPKKCDRICEFYGIDVGYWCPYVLQTHVLAVTDRVSNEVMILDANSLAEKQRIRESNSEKGSELVQPSDVACSSKSDGLLLAIVDKTDKVKVYKMHRYDKFRFDRAIDTQLPCCHATQRTTSASSAVTVDSVNHITIGRRLASGHNWLMKFGWDGVSSLDGRRISSTPSFLTFTHDHAQLLVSDSASGRVVSLTGGGSTRFAIDAKSFDQKTPTGVCCDTDGCIFVASVACSNGKTISAVHKYSPSGSHIACLGDYPHPIYGIVFTKEGQLAAACRDTVKLFDVPKV
ncbi:E3 ubiquitin-protein ligase TRIM45-like [Amphiura filiformis]|uniref:E3 ubiquitin-protein ligase TRIM45-like n=1 Tax=Amphiura filiformis TaxID=82378 RepID=UPI003B20F91F